MTRKRPDARTPRTSTSRINASPAAIQPSNRRAFSDDADGDDTDDDPPKDLDDFRIRLARRLAMMKQDWRQCRSAPCRRARACVDDRLTCRVKPPAPDRSNADDARVKHELLVGLRRVMRRRGEV